MSLKSYIDQPSDWRQPSRCVIIRGWCFSTDGNPVQAIRLRAGKTVLSGVVHLHRPDVKNALPEAPHENTGFEIRGTLPSGRLDLAIEVRLNDGTWTQIFARRVRVKTQLLPLWLGGGDWMELMFFQMPTVMAYPARPLRAEKFPALRPGLARPKFVVLNATHERTLDYVELEDLKKHAIDLQ